MNKVTHRVFVTVAPSRDFLKKLNKQTKNIGSFKVLAMVGIGIAIWSEVERRKQEEIIYRLSVRVKKLECGEDKGE